MGGINLQTKAGYTRAWCDLCLPLLDFLYLLDARKRLANGQFPPMPPVLIVQLHQCLRYPPTHPPASRSPSLPSLCLPQPSLLHLRLSAMIPEVRPYHEPECPYVHFRQTSIEVLDQPAGRLYVTHTQGELEAAMQRNTKHIHLAEIETQPGVAAQGCSEQCQMLLTVLAEIRLLLSLMRSCYLVLNRGAC